ncbi:MAG: SpoIIIAH-like family protein [Clostridia bacterium]|nr:SpoIIIAH-like family protein [Clostridia bacterium]
MKVIKKNQIIIALLGICLLVVGYVNYTDSGKKISNSVVSDVRNYTEGMGDAQLVSNDKTYVEEEKKDEEVQETVSKTEVLEEVKEDYFTSCKIERNNIYSQTIEVYEKMLESSTITNEQKAIAQNEIQKATQAQNSILIAENLLRIKGFEDVVIFVNNDNVSVIVKSNELTQEQVAQIQNIVSREFGVENGKISITNKA